MTSKNKRLSFQLNGKSVTFQTHSMARLLDVIREQAGLTGTKEGCGEGECGACSVLMNGEVVNSCLIPAIQTEGASIETIEGLAADPKSQALLEGFLKCGGAQCGICTPGMLVASQALLRKNSNPSRVEVREALSGNLCRCTGYNKIVDSVLAAMGAKSDAM